MQQNNEGVNISAHCDIRELVSKKGYVGQNEENSELGRGKRVQITNSFLKDFAC